MTNPAIQHDRNFSYVDFALSLQIHDKDAFLIAAMGRLIADGGAADKTEAYAFFVEDDVIDLARCATILIDPGTSPAGSKILESTSEEF